jgi:glycolate oxidase iron-sulfur subunit
MSLGSRFGFRMRFKFERKPKLARRPPQAACLPPMSISIPLETPAQAAAAADLCVLCGLCLPHCPTYRLLENEADSPRGRVQQMRAVFEGRLSESTGLLKHLNQCLGCRACERACPCGVPYGGLLDHARAQTRGSHPPSLKLRALEQIAASPLIRFSAVRTGYFAPSSQTHHGDVGLFLGCFARWLDRKTIQDAITVLRASGWGVWIPSTQGCCGALHRHTGDAQKADTLKQSNRDAFAGRELAAIVYLASGCGEEVADADSRAQELSAFLLKHATILPSLRSVRGTAHLHTPCSQKSLPQSHAARELLSQIPELTLTPLRHADCCGSAGTYSLRHPKLAAALRQPIVDEIQHQPRTKSEWLVSSNFACARHIGQELAMPTCHPVSLLRNALRI